MNFPGPCFRVDDNAKSYEPAFVVSKLTFLHISFAILFCQKKVKKNCKSAVRVFSKKADTRHRKRHGMSVSDFQLWFTGRGCVDLSLHEQNTHRPYPHPMGIKKQQGAESFPCSLLLTRIPCLTELRLICRGARLIQSAFCDHEHDVKPIRGDRSLSTFSHGNRACSLSFCCEAETFFSFSI